jgi:hypothetical protein
MQKVKKLAIAVGLLGLIALGGGVLIRLEPFAKPEREVRLSYAYQALVETAEALETAWLSGRFELDLSRCPGLTNLALLEQKFGLDQSQILKCNISALECALKQAAQNDGMTRTLPDRSQRQIFPVPLGEGKFVEVIYFSDPRSRGNPADVYFSLRDSSSEQALLFSLEDRCSETELPAGRYAHGVLVSGQRDWMWDTMESRIQIDRYPVSWGDFARWAQTQADWTAPLPVDWALLVADKVPKIFQKRFCEAQGKTLLQSHIADAAAFYPAALQTENVAIIPRGPYPQGRRRSATLLGRVLEGLEPELNLATHCLEIPTEECRELGFANLARLDSASSHSGVFGLLGGSMEHVRNPLNPEQNLILSSMSYAARSPIHAVGVRGSWNGESFEGQSVQGPPTAELSLVSEVSIGFRCMRRKGEAP